MNNEQINLTNINKGFEMVRYEVFKQDKRIKELENLLVVKNQQILRLENDLSELTKRYNSVFSSFSLKQNNRGGIEIS